MANQCAKWVGAGLGYFFEYETFKVVHIRSVTIGAINRLLQTAILGFIIGYVIVYEKGYQHFETPVSSVTTKVKGVGIANISSNPRVFDVADYVIPAQMKDSFFVMTNAIITPLQNQSTCPEDPDVVGVVCDPNNPSVNCSKGRHDMLGNGVQTGKCIPSDQKNVSVCEIHAWCPVEVDETPTKPLLPESENYTVLIKNSVLFPAFGVRRRNILETQNKSFLRDCQFNAKDPELKLCPVFRLGEIAKQAGYNDFHELAINGSVMSISIVWNCDFDYSVEHCVPVYRFARIDLPNTLIAPGFNFRYANYWKDENGNELRTLYKAYGILFIVQVQGKAGKFDVIPLATNLGSGLALLAIVSIICDILLLYCVKMKDYYRKKKYLVVTGDDAFNSQLLVGNENEDLVEDDGGFDPSTSQSTDNSQQLSPVRRQKHQHGSENVAAVGAVNTSGANSSYGAI